MDEGAIQKREVKMAGKSEEVCMVLTSEIYLVKVASLSEMISDFFSLSVSSTRRCLLAASLAMTKASAHILMMMHTSKIECIRMVAAKSIMKRKLQANYKCNSLVE